MKMPSHPLLKNVNKIDKKKIVFIVIALFTIFITLEGMGYYIGSHKGSISKTDKFNNKVSKKGLSKLKAKNWILKNKLKSLSPDGTYIVVDTARNILFLKKGEKIIREAVISSGSGNVLKDPNGRRKWVFDTPKGEFMVKTKYICPAWIKPDWAFIEEGEGIPGNFKDRVEEGSLGDFALGVGNGYFIHGTLYTRLLCRNVTHGCIRVGDEDLKYIFKASEIGTKIYIL
jgi:hypothetical protein